MPLLGLPIAVKKFDDIGCMKFKNVKNKNILNYHCILRNWAR